MIKGESHPMAASFSDLPNNSWGMVLLQFSDTSSL